MKGVRLEGPWIPSGVNRFSHALSRTWDPGDDTATEDMVHAIKAEFKLKEENLGSAVG